MEISKLRKVLTNFERSHGKLYELVDVEVEGEDITFNAKAAKMVDGARLNIVNVDCEPAALVDGITLGCNQETFNMLDPMAPAV